MARDNSTYHQRATLNENIGRYVAEANARSLLDIGPGSADRALETAKLVEGDYHAVERDEEAASSIRGAGLAVTAARFPTAGLPPSDVVLSSHSIPQGEMNEYYPFLERAWSLTKKLLLIVTFKGADADLERVERELRGVSKVDKQRLGIIQAFDGFPAPPTIEYVNSYFEASTADSVADYFLPWLARSEQERDRIRSGFKRIVNARYKVRDGLFVFPTEHLFLSVRR